MKCSRSVLIIIIWVVFTNPGLVVGADNLLIVEDDQEESPIVDESNNAGDEKIAAGNKLRKKSGVKDKSTRYGVGYEFRMKRPWQANRSRGAGRSHRSSRSGRRR